MRDFLTWIYGAIRKNKSFLSLFEHYYGSSDQDYNEKDEMCDDFIQWFYTQLDYFGSCSGEVTQHLDDKSIFPMWGWDKICTVLMLSAFRTEGDIFQQIHWQINHYIEKHKIEFEAVAYYKLLIELEAKYGESKVTAALWEGEY